MKKLLVAVAAVAAMSAWADLKVGTVDMMKLVKEHPQYEYNKKLLEGKESDLQKKMDRLRADLEAIQEEGKKAADQLKNPMLAQAAKDKVESELMEIQKRFLTAQQKLREEAMKSQEQLQELEADLLKVTTKDLHEKIDAFAQANGYDLILDAAVTPFAKKEMDVTDAVQKTVAAGAAKKAAVPEK